MRDMPMFCDISLLLFLNNRIALKMIAMGSEITRVNLKKRLLFCPLISILLLTACNKHQQDSNSENKPRPLVQSNEGEIIIEGSLAFYWNQLLEPADFQVEKEPAVSAWFDFPGTWNYFEIGGKKLPGRGCATYRTWFWIDSVMPMAIKTDDYCNAVKIWINGELVAQGGEPGSAKEFHKAVKYNIVEPFVPLEGLNEIIFQTSNFEEYYGGFRHAILLGSEALVVAAASKTKLIDSFVLGVIFIMALYHFSLFWMNTENKAFLWFGLLALFIGLRMGLLSSTNIFGVWLNEQAVLFLRLSFLLALILPMTLFYYFSSVFPEYLRRRTVNVYGVLSLFAILFIFLLPVYYLSSGVRYFQFIISLGLAYLLFLILRFFKFMSVTEKIIGLGILLLLLSVVFEILIFNRMLYSDYVAHYGLLGFIVFQSFALSYDFHLASKRNIELTRELDRHNKNLQEEVEIKSREVLEAKQREMVAMALQKSRVNRVLGEIEEKLILFKQQNKVESDKSFSEVLDLVKESKYNWKDEEYLLQFEKVHPQFFDKLLKAHPSLTKLEIHLCAYLKMNFGYQEIAHFQHIESESVRRSITRMRKKMELDSNRDIAAYLTLFS